MFAEMGVKTFFIGVCKDDPQRATVMFQGLEDVLYNIFTNPETKPIVEASGHVYEGTVITVGLHKTLNSPVSFAKMSPWLGEALGRFRCSRLFLGSKATLR